MRKPIRFPYAWLSAAVALAAGEALGLVALRWASLWPLAAVTAVLVVLAGFGRAWRGWALIAIAFGGLALAWRHEAARRELFLRSELSRGPLVVELEVTEAPRRRGDWASFYAVANGVAIEAILPIIGGECPRLGERWRIAGWLERKHPADRRRRTLWVKGRGTFAAAVGESRFAAAYRLAAQLRHRFSRAIAVGLGERRMATKLHRAMLLGERTSLPRVEKQNFIEAGTMHVFAISGLHVGVVAVVIVVLLMVALVPLRLAGVLMVPILWSYVFLIGLPPSAVRAAVMASCYFLAPAFWQRSNGLVAWSQAMVIVHVVNPGALASVGSLLSFAVMLAILLYDRWAGAMGLGGWVKGLGMLFAIWAAGAPISAMVFGRLTPGGMLANLVVVPLATVAVSCGFVGTLLSLFCPVAGSHLNNAAALVTDAMRGISAAVASIPGANFETLPWTWWHCVLWYLALLVGAVVLLCRVRHTHWGRKCDIMRSGRTIMQIKFDRTVRVLGSQVLGKQRSLPRRLSGLR